MKNEQTAVVVVFLILLLIVYIPVICLFQVVHYLVHGDFCY